MARTIGGYEVVRELARGGMGVLLEVTDPRTGARRALKTLRPTSPEEALRFQREAELLARLDHPGIVRIHAAGTDPAGAFIVMDLLAGGSLQDRLDREGPLPFDEAARVVAVIARAVAHAHAHGVLHRDLKPANVVFDAPGGDPRLVDFGLARPLDAGERLTATGVLLGTPTYMAPEQALGRPADERTDVHGLGAVLFAALTGHAPRRGATVAAAIASAARDPAPSPSALRAGVPPALERACTRAMDPDPAARFATPLDLARALEGRHEPARARGPLVVAAMGLAALVLALVAMRPTPGRPPPAPLPSPTGELDAPAAAPVDSRDALVAARRAELERVIASADLGAAAAALESRLTASDSDVDALRAAAAVIDAPETTSVRLGTKLLELTRTIARLEERDPAASIAGFFAAERLEGWPDLALDARGVLRVAEAPLERLVAARVLHLLGRGILLLIVHPAKLADAPEAPELRARLATLGADPSCLALGERWGGLIGLDERGAPGELPRREELSPGLRPFLDVVRVHERATDDLDTARAALGWLRELMPRVRSAAVLVRRLQREVGRLERHAACEALAAGAPRTAAGVEDALARSRELLLAASHASDPKNNRGAELQQLVITRLVARELDTIEAELELLAPRAARWQMAALRAELALVRDGDPAAALGALGRVEPRREVRLVRAHALRLLGDARWEDELRGALSVAVARDDLGLEWRAPYVAARVVRGEAWWPGR